MTIALFVGGNFWLVVALILMVEARSRGRRRDVLILRLWRLVLSWSLLRAVTACLLAAGGCFLMAAIAWRRHITIRRYGARWGTAGL